MDEEEEEYPHHSARTGDRFQAVINEFDIESSTRYKKTKRVYEELWKPGVIPEDELERFTSQFPPDVLEDVYDVIRKNNYDLKKSFEDVGFSRNSKS